MSTALTFNGEEFEYIQSFPVPSEVTILPSGTGNIAGIAYLMEIPSTPNTPWYGTMYSPPNSGYYPYSTITRFNSDFSVGERIYPRSDESDIVTLYGAPIYDPNINRIIVIRFSEGYGLYSMDTQGRDFKLLKFGSANERGETFRALGIRGDERYIIKVLATGVYSVFKYNKNWSGEELVAELSDFSPPYLAGLDWDGKYWYMRAFDSSLEKPILLYQFNDNWEFVKSMTLPDEVDPSSVSNFTYSSSEDKWYAAAVSQVHQLTGKQDVPSGVNLIQYNGQDILDVKYSDSNSVLQNVEMNLGSAPVWGGTPAPEQEWGLQFDGVNDYMTFPNFEIEPSQDFSIKLTAEFKASTMLLGNDSDTLSYIYCTSSEGGRVTAKIEDGSVESSQVFSEGGIQEGQVIEIELRRLNNTLYMFVDGVLGDSAPNGNASNFNTIGSWGNSASQPLFYSGMLKGKLEFLLGPGFNSTFYVARSYDFNLSGNSKTGSGQPVLIDTISGENAVGVNMNTDDSNWVELIAP